MNCPYKCGLAYPDGTCTWWSNRLGCMLDEQFEEAEDAEIQIDLHSLRQKDP